jgi:hypothetical protein
MASTARRTSRRPKRRTSRPSQNKRRTSRKTAGNARKGRLTWKHVKAQEMKGNDPTFRGPVFKGRIRLDRGAGVLEFPNGKQFQRIAREEGVPAEKVERAFGHLMPQKKTKRRTSRRVKKNVRRKRVVRRDLLATDQTLKSEPSVFVARTYEVDPKDVERMGFARGVILDIGGKVSFLSAEDAMRRSYRWFSKQEFKKAFGHLMRGSLLGEQAPSRKIPVVYGPRTMRLGHWSDIELDRSERPKGIGSPQSDRIVEGQLILFYKPKGQVVWQAFYDPTNPEKPIVVKYGGRVRNMEWSKAFSTAMRDRNIPAMAFIEAFGFHLPPRTRKELIREFMAPGPRRR